MFPVPKCKESGRGGERLRLIWGALYSVLMTFESAKVTSFSWCQTLICSLTPPVAEKVLKPVISPSSLPPRRVVGPDFTSLPTRLYWALSSQPWLWKSLSAHLQFAFRESFSTRIGISDEFLRWCDLDALLFGHLDRLKVTSWAHLHVSKWCSWLLFFLVHIFKYLAKEI